MAVTLTGFITVPLDRITAIRTALPEHIRLTRAEPGCLSFEVIEDDTILGRFNVHETFKDAESFRAHQARATQTEWACISEGIPRTYEISGL